MNRAIWSWLAGACLAAAATAQPLRGHLALTQAVRDAASDRLVAIVATHPDDPWTVPAAYLRFRKGYRVAVILVTRGEGGQNITGPEVGDALGRLRTLETEASAELLDCEVYYLNRADAGYCRTGREALELWGREQTMFDFARLLRVIRPDIVLTTHGPHEQHGHDEALLEILAPSVELACAAGEEIAGLAPARVVRLFRGAGDERPDLVLPTGAIDAERGLTYREMAYAALRLHRSQAPFEPLEVAFEPEERLVALPVGDRRAEPSLGEGLPSVFDDLRPRLAPHEIERLRADLEVELSERLRDPNGLRGLALDLRRRLRALAAPAGSELSVRITRRADALERIVRHTLALHASVEVRDGMVAVPGEPLPITVVAHHLPDALAGIELRPLGDHQLETSDMLAGFGSTRIAAAIRVPADHDADPRRGFLADTWEPPVRLLADYRVPQAEDALSFVLDVPVEIRPAVELEVFPPALLVPDGVDSVAFAVRVRRNTREPIDDYLAVRTELGVRPEPIAHRVTMVVETLRQYDFRLHLPPNATTMRARVRLGHGSAEVPLHRVDVEVDPELRVGLVRGVDDTARSILRGLGVETIELTESMLPTRQLSDLDTIVVDIRALRSHAAAAAGFNRLVDFARAGGRLVVFYHKDAEFNVESSGFRGYPPELPLHVGKGRVTREDQPVTVLIEDHPLLVRPNRIRPGDWDGWVQERGLYFPDDYHEDYDEVLGMSDPGQPQERSSLLYGRVGEGEFVYCALALYRQLKNLHPGACRLFANLISKPAMR